MALQAIRRVPWLNIAAVVAVAAAAFVLVTKNSQGFSARYILNASYDPTRELYDAINPRFVKHYEANTDSTVAVRQSHAGSTYQARQVASGELPADVVTLGLPSDVEILHTRGLIPDGWEKRLPNNSRPYESTIVFAVRKGNPHAIRDWPDLVKPGIEIMVPDPKTSGNGKLAALAAWGSVVLRGGTDEEARAFLKAIYDHAPFFTPAARATGIAFAVEKRGDVHLAWENEALREAKDSRGAIEVVYPPISIRAEPTVAWVDANVAKHGSLIPSKAYLEYLFTDEAQEIIAAQGYRPYKAEILKKHADRLPPINLFPITAIAGGWSEAQFKFFSDTGIIQSVYTPKPRAE
ncbi:sulfate ABC transporter substrate-binding protein [Xanthobacter sp. V4C-4]|uniref:sulfate ABC transporter substrate-binding protein n=1 Tax=Xanthobacter cornucopiae TaxID=3119924 RepID=UPI00372939ED